MCYESLWNHVVIKQGVFNRLKITYYIAISMNNSEGSWDHSDLQFLEKKQKMGCNLSKKHKLALYQTQTRDPNYVDHKILF